MTLTEGVEPVNAGGDAAAATAAGADAHAGATIRRDEFGVVHITAPTEEAAAYAHGYAAAEDHIEDLAPLFLRARGEQGSVFGEQGAREDLRVIELGISTNAEAYFKKQDPLMQRILDGYAAGYNAFLPQAGSRAPAWARPIKGSDVLAHCRAVLLINFSSVPSSYTASINTPPTASNLWAAGRKKSKSGRGLLLGNPHLPWNSAYMFHEVHLNVPRAINVAGASLIGFPVVVTGFNEWLGWAHTAAFKGGAEQLYRVTVDPADPRRYLHDGRSQPFSVATTTLRVKTATGEESRQIEVWSSHHGPVIRKDNTYAWAFSSPNLGPLDFLTQYNKMAKAKSLAEFQAALQMQQLPILNIGYSDRDGNVLYVENGRYADRPALPPGQKWLAGDKVENDLRGILPQRTLPQLLNPPSGFVQNANNSFLYTTLGSPIDVNGYPERFHNQGPPSLRAQHSLRMLETRKDLTLDEMVRAQFDTSVPMAARVKSDLIALIKSDTSATGDLAAAAQALETWNDRISAESAGATLFARWWGEYSRAKPEKTFAAEWDANRPLDTPNGIGDRRLALEALTKVTADLRQNFGSVSPKWGDVYRLRRGTFEAPAPGASDSLGFFNSLEFSREKAEKGGKWVARNGSAYILAVDFQDVPVAMSVVPYSQSADPASKHAHDQTEVFARGALKRFWFAEADVERHTVRRYTPGAKSRAAGAR